MRPQETDPLESDNSIEPNDVLEQRAAERRRLLLTGAVVVPTILTLHATPAWAGTDYTVTAYRYGVHAGLCRNAHFNPNADPNSQAGQEFIQCRQRPQPYVEDTPTSTTTGSGGATSIQIK